MNNPVKCEGPSGHFVVYISGVGVQGFGVDSDYATTTSYTTTIGGGGSSSFNAKRDAAIDTATAGYFAGAEIAAGASTFIEGAALTGVAATGVGALAIGLGILTCVIIDYGADIIKKSYYGGN